MNTLIPFTPTLKLGLLPALHAALVKIQELAHIHEHAIFVNPTMDPRGLQLSIGTLETAAIVVEEAEYLVCFLDYSPVTQMFLLLDEDGITHRVNTTRAVFGLLW